MADNFASQLRNLEQRLSMAIDNAKQAESDLNRVRLLAGLEPIPARAARLKEEYRWDAYAEGNAAATSQMIVDAAARARGEAAPPWTPPSSRTIDYETFRQRMDAIKRLR
jgi:hypothetical protein